MHLTTEQHGAYLLLIFHLWRRGCLPADDAGLAKIAGLSAAKWSTQRPVLAQFFALVDGSWVHGRVDRERCLAEARQRLNGERAQRAAARRWQGAPADDAAIDGPNHARSNAPSNAPSIPQALLEECESQSPSQSQSQSPVKEKIFATAVSSKRVVIPVGDVRHVPFRRALSEYWQKSNPAQPEMPWQGRDGRALSEFLKACPQLEEAQFRRMLANRAQSAVAHGDRVYLWIANLTRLSGSNDGFNKPVSAGGGLVAVERTSIAIRSSRSRPRPRPGSGSC